MKSNDEVVENMIDTELVSEFIKGFFGYGNPNSNFWFIGKEEGGGNSFQEFNKRIRAWECLEKGKLLDLVEYHRLISLEKFFTQNAILQPTWNKLIRIYLSANDLPRSTEDVRRFQIDHLARKDSNNALLELFPLASPNSRDWLYPEWTKVSQLRSREAYITNILPFRISMIRSLIEEFQPKFIIFYGSMYEEYWQKIISIPLKLERGLDLKFVIKNDSLIISIKHPVFKGLTNEYFHSIGQWIKQKMK